MTSRKLFSVTSLLTLASLCVVALALSACDDKAQDEDNADVAILADSANTRAQGQQKTAKSGSQKAGDKQAKRTSASSPGEATVTQKAPLDASLYLTKDDIPGMGNGPVQAGTLVGKEPSATYGTVRFYPKRSRANEHDSYGMALQLWKLDDEDAAEEMIGRMREQYLGVDDAPKNAPVRRDKAFLSSRAGITTYVFAAQSDAAGYVAAVSCGQTTCPKGWANVRPVAKEVLERILNPGARDDLREERRERAEKAADIPTEERKEIERRKEIEKRKEIKRRKEAEMKRRE